MNKTTFEGKVFTGGGNGKIFLSLPWVQSQIEEKLGFTPFLGTLNLKLSEGDALRRKQLERADALRIYPTDGYCEGLLFRATIGKMECAVIIPKVKDYPKNVIEIIAPINLRVSLGLSDEDSVAVTVQA